MITPLNPVDIMKHHRRVSTALFGLILLVLAAGCGGGEKPAPKILVVGLDGATFDLMTPWMEAGYLPRMKALRDGGAWGTLQSVIPPLSPPAWTTAFTGVNPGQHGIYDFFRLDPDSMIALSETAAGRRVPALWTLLSDDGRKVGVANIPMTDPPDPVNGFLIAGLPHPDTTGYAYPPQVEADLHRRGYRLDRMGEALIEGRRARWRRRSSTRTTAAVTPRWRWAQRTPISIDRAVFTGTDRMQHFFWKFMEKDHPFYDAALTPRLRRQHPQALPRIDAAVGALVDQAQAQADKEGRELAVIVLSDHGFSRGAPCVSPTVLPASPHRRQAAHHLGLQPRDQRHASVRAACRGASATPRSPRRSTTVSWTTS